MEQGMREGVGCLRTFALLDKDPSPNELRKLMLQRSFVQQRDVPQQRIGELLTERCGQLQRLSNMPQLS
jgi:hypothetical protein